MVDKKAEVGRKGGAISQATRIKGALRDVKDDLGNIAELRKLFAEEPGQKYEAVETYYRYLEQLGDDVVRLVHLDNDQLHHSAVQWLLSSPRSKEFLRKLHWGLETGINRGVEAESEEERYANAIMVLNSTKETAELVGLRHS